MAKPNLTDLLHWREDLAPGKELITRDGRYGILVKKKGKMVRILFGKGHECSVKADDIFPTNWNTLVLEWLTKKPQRGPDLPLSSIGE